MPKSPARPLKPAKTPRIAAGTGHRLITHTRLVNGVVETTYSCPCDRFHQSGMDSMTGKRVPKTTVRERFERHLAL